MVASVMHHTPTVAPSVGAWMRRKKVGSRTSPNEPMAANAAPSTANTAVRISAHSGSGPMMKSVMALLPGSFDYLAAQQELRQRGRSDEAEQRDQHGGLEVDIARVHDAEDQHHQHAVDVETVERHHAVLSGGADEQARDRAQHRHRQEEQRELERPEENRRHDSKISISGRS